MIPDRCGNKTGAVTSARADRLLRGKHSRAGAMRVALSDRTCMTPYQTLMCYRDAQCHVDMLRMSAGRPITRRSMTLGLGSIAAVWSAVAPAQSPRCAAPTDLADGWRVSAAEAVGLDSRHFCAMAEWLDELRGCNIHSVLVVRQGKLAFEHYRRGSDRHWARSLPDVAHGPTVLHDLRSISKSVTSLLVGIALDRKLISSVDQPVFEYFPEYSDLRTPEKDRITLRHLLTMSAGLEWDENLPYTNPNNSEVAMLRSADRWRFAIPRRERGS